MASSVKSVLPTVKSEEKVFGEDERESSTFGEWTMKVEPVLTIKLRDGRCGALLCALLSAPSSAMVSSRCHRFCCRALIIQNNSKGFGELGSHVWDAGLFLARFIESEQARKLIRGKKCIELGTGTGIVGIAAAMVCLGVSTRVSPNCLFSLVLMLFLRIRNLY